MSLCSWLIHSHQWLRQVECTSEWQFREKRPSRGEKCAQNKLIMRHCFIWIPAALHFLLESVYWSGRAWKRAEPEEEISGQEGGGSGVRRQQWARQELRTNRNSVRKPERNGRKLQKQTNAAASFSTLDSSSSVSWQRAWRTAETASVLITAITASIF